MVTIYSAPQGKQELGTKDGGRRPVIFFRGAELFNLKATHGVPLDFAIDHILNASPCGLRCFIEWPSFITEARKNKRWDFQTYDDIRHALEDCESYSKEEQQEILDRFKIFVLKYPHPEMRERQERESKT